SATTSVPVKVFAPVAVKSAVKVAAADWPVSGAWPVQWPVKSYGAAANAPPATIPSATATPSSRPITILLHLGAARRIRTTLPIVLGGHKRSWREIHRSPPLSPPSLAPPQSLGA